MHFAFESRPQNTINNTTFTCAQECIRCVIDASDVGDDAADRIADIMENADEGESSRKKHAHDDGPAANGRPLKKAKFPWQVKGKFHRKDQDEAADDEPTADAESAKCEAKGETPPSQTPSVENKFEDNLEMLGDYLLKQDFSSLNTLLFGPEADQAQMKSNDSGSEESASSAYPKYTPSYTKVPSSNNNQDVSVTADVNLSKSSGDAPNYASVVKQRIEDQYLKRWQARQIAKGYVDNTINRVLDSWFVAPLPPYLDDNRQLTLDVTGLLDDLAGNDGIENEGILMAISAHGLQNSQSNSTPRSRNSNSKLRNRSLSDSALNADHSDGDIFTNNIYGETSGWFRERSQSPKSKSPTPDRSSVDNSSTAKPEATSDASDGQSWRHFSQPCNCSNTNRNNKISNVATVPFHRRNRSSPMPDFPESDNSAIRTLTPVSNEQSSSTPVEKSADAQMEEEESEKKDDENQNYPVTSTDEHFEEHFDFIDAAVSFAIQAKGLIPF